MTQRNIHRSLHSTAHRSVGALAIAQLRHPFFARPDMMLAVAAFVLVVVVLITTPTGAG
jgi:hypothetical protein